MAGFNMADYVDVAERIAQFNEKYPEGSLQAEVKPREQDGFLVGWFAVAYAYRNPDDIRPGVGHAYEPVPGKTPYTRDSEAMNAETSAWGRAIIALGFRTKKIASQQEVSARQDPASGSAGPAKQTRKKPVGKPVGSGSAAGTQSDAGAAASPPPSAAPANPQDNDGFASPEQRSDLFNLTKEEGVSNARLREILQMVTGQQTTAQIPANLYQKVVDTVRLEGVPFE